MIRFLKSTIIFSLLLATQLIWAETLCPNNRPDLFCLTPEMAPESPVKIFEFYAIPSNLIGLFHEELKSAPAPLYLDAKWESPFFGAGVSLYQDQFSLMVLGGTTRVPGFSLEAYAALICHELGHILGGHPKQTIPGAEWASAEGQADFFAASICLPRYFKSLGVKESLIPKAIENAGFEMMWAFRNFDSSHTRLILVRDAVNLEVVGKTLKNEYPTIQCRYETFRNPKSRSSCWFKD